jgi:hypothetical protein
VAGRIKTAAVLLCAALAGFGSSLQVSAGTNFGAFSYALNGTNINLRIALTPDSSNYFTFDESTNLPGFTTRLTTLGGGSNAWNFAVLNPDGGLDPTLVANGGGTNEWNFSASLQHPQMFWRIRQMPSSPPVGYMQFTYSLSGIDLNVHFHLTPDLTNYYILDIGTNLIQFTPILMYYGGGSNAWAQSAMTTQNQPTFWRVRRIPISTALDTDGDGLDDAFELSHGLNPFDPSDANANSGLVDANNNPLTWLGVYHYYFVHNTIIYDSVSREVSGFNFGQPAANYEAISREISAFNVSLPDNNGDGIEDTYEASHGITNANQPSGFTTDFPNNTGNPLTWLQLYRLTFGQNRTLYETAGRELSVFNFGQSAANYEAVSRETSVFNFGQPTANYEAVSREVAVFNIPGQDANNDGIDDAYEFNHGITTANANQTSGFADDNGNPLTWLQLYHNNFGANRTLYDAASREVSAFNVGQPTANYEAVSRELSVFNQP